MKERESLGELTLALTPHARLDLDLELDPPPLTSRLSSPRLSLLALALTLDPGP